jgi:LacI family transcriptional regulator
MADVGRLAGVSASTVSFVLNESSGQTISPSTRERVLESVALLGYRPNRMARGLRTRRAATIGLVAEQIAAQPAAGPAILGAHEVAWAHDSLLLVVNITRSRRIVREVIEELVNRPVDAILFALQGDHRLNIPDVLKGVPGLTINGKSVGTHLPAVLPDEVAGARSATELLVRAGHRRIAYLTGRSASWATKDRLRGFAAALVEAGLDPRRQVVRHGDLRVDSGYELTRQLIHHEAPPTAIMCGSDRMAAGAYLALAEAGIRVPEEMSVVGHDDEAGIADGLRPGLSTVRLPYRRLGRWAAGQAVAGTIGRLPADSYLPCPPVPRDSVAAPRPDDRKE